MRAFIVLCLLAVASADKLGYNYHPVAHSDTGLSFIPGGSSNLASSVGGGIGNGLGVGIGSGLGGGIGSGLGGGIGGGSGGVIGGDIGGGISGVSSDIGSSLSGVSTGGFSGSSGTLGVAPQVEVEKEFYSFSANEEDFVEPAIEQQVANSAKQSVRVIFIKGPENKALENAALSLAKQAAEQRTAIYVFNKQPDVNGLSQKLNIINNNVNNKPEVHFVKYRTPEDAANAQRVIQSHYDTLGGTTQNFNGGAAPVLNFASSPSSLGSGSLGSGSLGSGSLSSGSFGSGSLGSALLSSGSLGSGSLGSGSLSSGSLGSGSFGYGSLGSGSLGSGLLGSGSVGTSPLTSGSLGSGSFRPGGSLPTSVLANSAPSSTYLPAFLARRFRK